MPAHRDIDELLRHGSFLRSIAAGILGDAHAAEDVVQKTWARALERPPVARSHSAFRAWLGRVARNFALSDLRSRERRASRERERSAPEGLPGPDERADELSLQKDVVAAVLALREPYQSVVHLRYYHGLGPRAIAERLGVPEKTVKARLTRAHAFLREHLDGRSGGRKAWALALGRFVRPELAPGPSVAQGSPEQVGASSAPMLGPGASLLRIAGVTLVPLASIGAFVWVAQRLFEPHTPMESRNVALSDVAAPGKAPRRTAVVSEAGSVSRVAFERSTTDHRRPIEPLATGPKSGEGEATLEVHAVRAADGQPLDGIVLKLISWDVAAPLTDFPHGRTDARGIARFEGVPVGRSSVEGQRGGSITLDIELGINRASFVLPIGIGVSGRVLALDAPVAGASIWLSDYGNEKNGHVVAETDREGRFILRDVGPSRFLAAHAPGYAPSMAVSVPGNAGETIEVELELSSSSGQIAGRVTDVNGHALEAAAVQFTEVRVQRERREGVDLYPPPPRVTRTDASGSFQCDGVWVGEVHAIVRASGHVPKTRILQVDPGQVARYFVTLERGARVDGRVLDRNFEPVAKATVRLAKAYSDVTIETRSGPDGFFELSGIPPGPAYLRAVHHTGGETGRDFDLQAGETVRWDAILSAGKEVGGKVAGADGRPLVGWIVSAVELDEVGLLLSSGTTDSNGRFLIQNCPSTSFALAVRSPRGITPVPSLVVTGFEPGERDLELQVPASAMPSAKLRGRVLQPLGGPAREIKLILHIEGSKYAPWFPCNPDTGEFVIAPLVPREYRLEVRAKDAAPFWSRPVALAPGQDTDLGDLELEPGGRIQIELLEVSAVEASLLTFKVRAADGRIVDRPLWVGKPVLSMPLNPGLYTVTLDSLEGVPSSSVTVCAGQVVKAVLRPD